MFQINICRVCEKSTNLIDISLPNNNNLIHQYLTCANVSYKPDDGLPPYLCRLCATQLNYAYNFKQKCEETEIKLKEMLSIIQEKSDDVNQILIEDFTEDNSTQFDDQGNSTQFDDNIVNTDENFLPSDWTFLPSSKRQVRCDICKKRCLLMQTLEKHMRNSHGMKVNHRQCPKCFSSLKTYQAYIKHIKLAKHKPEEKCKHCGKTILSWNLQRHINTVHLELKAFICDICNKSYSQKTPLETHIISVHTSEYNYSCTVCNKKFKSKKILKKHKKIHLPGYEKIEKTKQQVGRLVICEFCGKKCTSKASLLIHERIHTGERPYQCDICKRSYHSQGYLNVHKSSHSEIKPHTCSLCNRSFSQLANLQRHALVHTGEKPFQCSYCEKSFAQSGGLRAHTRTHTGEKPYKCEHCSKCFSDCSTWIRHKRVHIK